MSASLFAALIGLLVFLVIIAVFLFVRNLRNKRGRQSFNREFKRVSQMRAPGSDSIKRSGKHKQPEKHEGKGRLVSFGILIAGILGTLTVKLWTLQILASDDYTKMAAENMTSKVSVSAIRGRILDRNGEEIVGNRPSLVVKGKKSAADDSSVVHRLSLVLGIPKAVIRRKLLDDTQGVQADREIAHDVDMRAVAFIKEHPNLFPGASVETRTIRSYPHGSLAAHVLGYTGPVTEDDLKRIDGQIKYESGDTIGKDGVELAFENILQGTRGIRTYKVDVNGQPTALLSEEDPLSGNDVRLTLDLKIQKATDKILKNAIASSHDRGFPDANAGALVCIDIEDGGILAASSYPTYNPEDFTGGISTELWEQLTNKDSAFPLTNRVIAGLYPAASTFKAFTSLAGLERGIVKKDTEHTCMGEWYPYEEGKWGQRCWTYPDGHGKLGLEEAINHSCDVFFYNIGRDFYDIWDALPEDSKVDELQDYLRSWGFGSLTGIDIPGELPGRVPDEKWKKATFVDTPEEALWQPGDMSNMCIGQGDILITPLQLAYGFSGIAGKRLITPHLFNQVIDENGEVVVSFEPKNPQSQPAFKPEHIARVQDGLRRVVIRNGSFDVLPVEVAGKTGTAEVKAAKADFSWFVGYAPYDKPKYCVACLVEQAGMGSSAAILGVLHTFASIYDTDIGEIQVSEGAHER